MFTGLTDRFADIFDRLTKRGALSEDDVRSVMREIRVALLEADVALPVVKDFTDRIAERAVGEEVMRSVTPGQQVIKIVNDGLVEMLGPESQDLEIRAAPPAAVMMVGLQGSGKTTTAAKIGKRLQEGARRFSPPWTCAVRRPSSSSPCSASRPGSRRCRSCSGSRPARLPSGRWTRRAGKATTWSSSTPPAAPRSTTR